GRPGAPAARVMGLFFFSSRRRHTRSVSAFLLNRSSDLMFSVLVIRRRRITIPLTLSNLKLLRRITRTENILHRNFTRRQVAIQRSEERRVGKECRTSWAAQATKKKTSTADSAYCWDR